MSNNCDFLHIENYQREVKDKIIEKLQAVKQDTDTKLEISMSKLESAESEAKINILEAKVSEKQTGKNCVNPARTLSN